MRQLRAVSTLVRAAVILALTLLASPPVEAQELTLRVEAGRVWLSAEAAPVRDVIERWASASGVSVLGLGGIRDAPVTLHLTDVAEQEALELLLKDVAGYVLVERPPDADGQPTGRALLVVPLAAGAIGHFAESPDGAPVRPFVLERLAEADTDTTTDTAVARPTVPTMPTSETEGPGVAVELGTAEVRRPVAPEPSVPTATQPTTIRSLEERPDTSAPREGRRLERGGSDPASQ